MITCEMCKTLIEKGRYEKEEMRKKLDLFLLGNRITEEQYSELVALMESKTVA